MFVFTKILTDYNFHPVTSMIPYPGQYIADVLLKWCRFGRWSFPINIKRRGYEYNNKDGYILQLGIGLHN